MRRLARERGSSAAVGALSTQTPSGLLRLLGRVLVWGVIALLLVRGVNDLVGGRDEPAAAVQTSRAALPWPGDEARAFAVDFARAYLTFSPANPARYARGLRGFMPTELVDSVSPRFAQRGSGQSVVGASVARTSRIDSRRALVTVAVAVDTGRLSTTYLAVPVARDAQGGLTVYDLPSFAAPPARAVVDQPAGDALAPSERPAIEDVLTRFFGAFVSGRSADLEYLVAAGVRIGALAEPFELVQLDSVALAAPARGRTRQVTATVRVRDLETRAIYPLRYRVGLVHGDRWYVAAVNNPKER